MWYDSQVLLQGPWGQRRHPARLGRPKARRAAWLRPPCAASLSWCLSERNSEQAQQGPAWPRTPLPQDPEGCCRGWRDRQQARRPPRTARRPSSHPSCRGCDPDSLQGRRRRMHHPCRRRAAVLRLGPCCAGPGSPGAPLRQQQLGRWHVPCCWRVAAPVHPCLHLQQAPAWQQRFFNVADLKV